MYRKSNQQLNNTATCVKPVSNSSVITLLLVILNGIVLSEAYTSNKRWYQVLLLTIPLLALSIWTDRKKKQFIQQNFAQSGSSKKAVSRKKEIKSPSEIELQTKGTLVSMQNPYSISLRDSTIDKQLRQHQN